MEIVKIKVIHLINKVRRFLIVSMYRGLTIKKLQKRRGYCNRCGACCKLLLRCPAYAEKNGEGYCTIYEDRPGICALYPIDKSDLKELRVTMPDIKCTYDFVEVSEEIPKETEEFIRQSKLIHSLKGTLKITKKLLREERTR